MTATTIHSKKLVTYAIVSFLLTFALFAGSKLGHFYLGAGYYLSKHGASASTMLGYDTAALIHTTIWGLVNPAASLALGL